VWLSGKPNVTREKLDRDIAKDEGEIARLDAQLRARREWRKRLNERGDEEDG
jgi:hypothetical protein